MKSFRLWAMIGVCVLSVGGLWLVSLGRTELTSYFDWFIVGGGAIGWLLIGMDIIVLALSIQYFLNIRAETLSPLPVKDQMKQMIDGKQYRELIEYTAAEPSMISYVMNQALTQAGRGYAAMEEAMEEAVEDRSGRLLRDVELLNLFGNIGPMLGLLGTVYGMILAFSEIVKVGGMPQPAKLAQSIGIALVTTFWGLVVAIPALAVYSTLRARVDELVGGILTDVQENISSFRPGAKKTAEAMA